MMQYDLLPKAALVFSLLSLAACLYTLWNLRSLNRLRNTLFTGASGENLESVLQRLAKEIKKLANGQDGLENALVALHKEFGFSVQKMGIVRFNPFEDGGGNFSFSLAILDGHNTGVVITSMHGRQQNRIYTKKIVRGVSDTTLTDEEKQAIELANQKT